MAQNAPDTSSRLKDHLGRQFGMLITQFLLGMGVNLLGGLNGSTAMLVGHIVLLLHVLVAIGLVVNGILIFRLARGSSMEKFARGGGASVGLAFLFGLLTMANFWSNLWSFGMAAAFIAAFVVYGKFFLELRTGARCRS